MTIDVSMRKVQADQLDLASPNAEVYTTGGANDLTAADTLVIADTSDGGVGKVATVQQVVDLVTATSIGAVTYQGTWNASTNTPTLPAAGSGNKGHYYVVAGAGGTYLTISYAVGDWIISNGTAWEKVDSTDQVTSVNSHTGVVVLTKSDVGLSNVDNTSDVNKPVSTATQTALNLKGDKTQTDASEDYANTIATSGIVTGGVLTLTGGVNFSISAGTGYIKTAADKSLKKLTWGTLTGTCTYNGDNFPYIDYDGNVQVYSSLDTTSYLLGCGYINTTAANTVVVGFSALRDTVIKDFQNTVQEFVQYAIGTIVESGCSIAEQANPNFLKVTMAAGSIWCHYQRLPISQTSTLTKLYNTADYGFLADTASTADTVIVNKWNNVANPAATALVTMTTGYWKKDLFFLTPDGTLYYRYGTAEYATEALAKAAPVPALPPSVTGDVVFAASVVTSTTSTTLVGGIYDIRPIFSRLFEKGSSAIGGTATSHHDLADLNYDDHSQYHNDTRGDARYSLLAHVHANVIAAGAAGFMTGADKTKLDGVATGATANSSDATLLARANHTGTQAFSTITSTPTTLSGYGIADAAPLSHVGVGGSAHANVVAAGAAGFMTGADKTKLDGVATGATANSSDATLLARANHTGTQAFSTITSTPTTLSGYGIADAAPLSHVGVGGSAHANVVAAGAAGFMTGADKTKLDGVATGATANSSDATLLARANHTGTQAFSTITSTPTTLSGYGIADAAPLSHVGAGGAAHANVVAAGAAGFMTGADKTKLDGVATGATANSSDATLLARANHTGTQAFSTITSTPTTLSGYGITDAVEVDLKDTALASAVTLNASPATVLSITIPANGLSTTNGYRVNLVGELINSSGANRTYTVLVSYGGTTLFSGTTAAVAASATARPMNLELNLVANASTSAQRAYGKVSIGGTTAMAASFIDSSFVGSSAVNSTSNQTLLVTITSSAATATQSFQRYFYLAEKF